MSLNRSHRRKTMKRHTICEKGLLNLPGITEETTFLTEIQLLADAEKHHCFFNSEGSHNHLSHQILAAYDMGASKYIIQGIRDRVAPLQVSIYGLAGSIGIEVNKDNWSDYLGKHEAYFAYFQFFRGEVNDLGRSKALELYVFLPEANSKERHMLDRFLSGSLHPLIQVGNGAEFGADLLIATGLAQTAVHGAELAETFSYVLAWGDDNTSTPSPSSSTGCGRQPSVGPSLLSILRQIYDSPVLAPPLPYDPGLSYSQRIKASIKGGKSAEILRIAQQYTHSIPNDASDEELESRIEELVWAVTLLMVATGHPGKEPRLDFYLMHLVTSSLFLKPVFRALKNSRAKVTLIRHYVVVLIVTMLSRGRPLIRANLVQEWTQKPFPQSWGRMSNMVEVKSSVVGVTREVHEGLSLPIENAFRKREDYDPWTLLIQGAIHHTDVHVAKVMRSLIHADKEYGSTVRGGVIGAFKPETYEESFEGMSQLDGTLFVRAAGVVMNYMGWTIFGEAAGDVEWDRSVLGYDEAWRQNEF